jgi:hypothetical protein
MATLRALCSLLLLSFLASGVTARGERNDGEAQ